MGNHGKRGIGGIFRDIDSNWILRFNISIPHATNIYMEGLDLMHDLRIDLQKNIMPLVIETDCNDLINMLTNNSCLYQNLINYCMDAK